MDVHFCWINAKIICFLVVQGLPSWRPERFSVTLQKDRKYCWMAPNTHLFHYLSICIFYKAPRSSSISNNFISYTDCTGLEDALSKLLECCIAQLVESWRRNLLELGSNPWTIPIFWKDTVPIIFFIHKISLFQT